MTERRIEIGIARSVQAGRRRVKVVPFSGTTRPLDNVEWVWFSGAEDNAGAPEEVRCRVEAVEDQAGEWAFTLAPGVTRDVVASVRGARVMIEASCVRCGVTDEFGADDILGFRVSNENGDLVGIITGGFSAGGNEVVEISTGDGGLVRIPLAAPVIIGVEWDESAITVRDLAPYAVEDSSSHAD